jgi:hypothetical protein
MNSLPTFSRDEIASCRIVCRQDDDSSLLRSRIAACFSRTSLHPSNIPPSSILLINKLQCMFQSSDTTGAPILSDDQTWVTAAKIEINRLLKNAHDPFAFIPQSADAIFFADEAELFTCFLTDLAHGEVGARWWWKHISRGIRSFGDAALHSMLLLKPHLIPAIVSLLQKKNELEPVLKKMPEMLCRDMLVEISRCFTIPWVMALVDKRAAPNSLGGDLNDADRTSATPFIALQEIPKKIHPPWPKLNHSAETPTEFPPIKDLFHGICLTLADRPFILKQSSFQKAVAAWWNSGPVATEPLYQLFTPIQADAIYKSDYSQPSDGAIKPNQQTIDRYGASGIIPERSLDIALTPRKETPSKIPVDEFTTSLLKPGSNKDFALRNEYKEHDADAESQKSVGNAINSDQFSGLFPKGNPLPSTHPDATDNRDVGRWASTEVPAELSKSDAKGNGTYPTASLGTSVPIAGEMRPVTSPPGSEDRATLAVDGRNGAYFTKFGSIFYLVNLFNKLSIPDAFEDDWGLSSQIGPWGTLDITVRFLAALDIKDHPDSASDPVFGILGELSGLRHEGVYGKFLRVPAHQKLPHWWQHLDIDGPCEIPPYAPLLTMIAPPAQQWASLCVPYMRQWLLNTLAIASFDLFSRTALGCPASLFLSSSHVDVLFDIEDISLLARIAGLDQNPGWLPSYGRVLQFHYEREST